MAPQNVAILAAVLAIHFAVSVVASSDAPVRRHRLELIDQKKKMKRATYPSIWTKTSGTCTDACQDHEGFDSASTRSTDEDTMKSILNKADFNECIGWYTAQADDTDAPYVIDTGASHRCYASSNVSVPDGFNTQDPKAAGSQLTYERLCCCNCVNCSTLERASNEVDDYSKADRTYDGTQFSLCYRHATKSSCENYYNVWHSGTSWTVKQCSWSDTYNDCRPTYKCCSDSLPTRETIVA